MAITPCRECGHQVSDQAASCPSCGVPIAPAVKTKPRASHRLSRALITLMVLWTLGTLLWVILPSGAPNELMTRAKLLLQPAKHVAITSPTAQPPATPSAVASVPPTQPALAPRPDTDHAAAQPYKTQLYNRDVIDVECAKVNQSGAVVQGNGCSLSFVETRTREVNLALILANESGTAHVYVVGPMSSTDCRTRSDEISSRLQGKQRGEHIVWKDCADAERESLLPAGCNLDSPSVALPEVPTAHLWRYDCGSSNVASHATTSHRSRPSRSRGNPSPLPTTTMAMATPAPTEPEPAVIANGATPSTPSSNNNIRLASADGAYIGGATTVTRIPPEEASVAHALPSRNGNAATALPQSGTRNTSLPQPGATTSDDLARVRATDPTAADHIASYCSKTAPLSNRDALMAECRRSEAEAWTRLVLQNEFPTLDDATRKKCSEPPFPDTYVAKESCARYSLHAN